MSSASFKSPGALTHVASSNTRGQAPKQIHNVRRHHRWWEQTARTKCNRTRVNQEDQPHFYKWRLGASLGLDAAAFHPSSLGAMSWSGSLWWKRQLIQRTHFKSPCLLGWGWAERERAISSCHVDKAATFVTRNELRDKKWSTFSRLG